MHTVSKVNSSPSMNSSQLATSTWRIGGDGRLELRLAAHLVGVGAAGAGDGLQDERVADLLGRLADLALGLHLERVRHAQPRGLHPLLHQLLVAEAGDRVDRHARHAEALAQAGREDDQRFPVGQHPVDAAAAQPGRHPLDDVGLVHDARAPGGSRPGRA